MAQNFGNSKLRSASSFALANGYKALVYGPPGEGKTPLIKTTINPVLLVCEPGMGSMRDAHNIPAWDGLTMAGADEFFKWLFNSAEAKKFDTCCVDSFSQYAELVLAYYLKKHSHGLKAYGAMSEHVMDVANKLFYMPQKHMYLICKEGGREEQGINKRVPFFPGQDLNVKMPHLFDAILRVARTTIMGQNGKVLAIQTRGDDVMARDRFGKLDEFEPPHFGNLVRKALS